MAENSKWPTETMPSLLLYLSLLDQKLPTYLGFSVLFKNKEKKRVQNK